jgi:undecaprenyl-diphosphatase
MNFWEAILFGIVQGITEFLPISSTAHIVITGYFLGQTYPGLSLEIFLHLASVLAVLCYFQRDLRGLIAGFFRYLVRRSATDRTSFLFGIYIIVATAITGVLGILLKDQLGDAMKQPPFVAAMLALTGCVLILTERFIKYGNRTQDDMTARDAIVVGLGQTVAVLPGISRAGSTLIAALLSGLERKTAVRFSFLLSVPVILGSSVLALDDLRDGMFGRIGWGPLAVSFVTTFFFSLIGIVWLIEFLKRRKLIWFAAYLFALALFIVLYFPSEMAFDIE